MSCFFFDFGVALGAPWDGLTCNPHTPVQSKHIFFVFAFFLKNKLHMTSSWLHFGTVFCQQSQFWVKKELQKMIQKKVTPLTQTRPYDHGRRLPDKQPQSRIVRARNNCSNTCWSNCSSFCLKMWIRLKIELKKKLMIWHTLGKARRVFWSCFRGPRHHQWSSCLSQSQIFTFSRSLIFFRFGLHHLSKGWLWSPRSGKSVCFSFVFFFGPGKPFLSF